MSFQTHYSVTAIILCTK